MFSLLSWLLGSSHPPVKTAENAKISKDDTLLGNIAVPNVPEPDTISSRLEKRGYSIISSGVSPLPHAIEGLVMFMGSHLDEIRPALRQVKIGCSCPGDRRNFNTSKQSPEIRATIRCFLEQLHQLGYLNYYRAFQDQHKLTVARAPEIQRFITGGWLEHYTGFTMDTVMSNHENYQRLQNVKLLSVSGENFEMDHLILVGGKLVWVEVKSGSYLNCLDRHRAQMAKLGLSAKDMYLVASDLLDEDIAEALTYNYTYNIVSLPGFLLALKNLP